MPTLTRDTTGQAEAVQLAILRRMPVWQKVALAAQLNQRTEELALRGLRTRLSPTRQTASCGAGCSI
jgi:hypothetical protein